MKTFTLSKKDLAFLGPNDAIMNGLQVAIKNYVVGEVYKRLSIDPTMIGRYDLNTGELQVYTPDEWTQIVNAEELAKADRLKQEGSLPQGNVKLSDLK